MISINRVFSCFFYCFAIIACTPKPGYGVHLSFFPQECAEIMVVDRDQIDGCLFLELVVTGGPIQPHESIEQKVFEWYSARYPNLDLASPGSAMIAYAYTFTTCSSIMIQLQQSSTSETKDVTDSFQVLRPEDMVWFNVNEELLIDLPESFSIFDFIAMKAYMPTSLRVRSSTLSKNDIKGKTIIVTINVDNEYSPLSAELQF